MHTTINGDYVAMFDEKEEAIVDALYEARKHPDAVLTVSSPLADGTTWTTLITANAARADEIVHQHYGCSNLDTQSTDFHCYTDQVTVRWIG